MRTLTILAILFSNLGFATDINLKTVDLQELFVIEDGFDSNDDVEVTLHAQLPSACYKPAVVSIKKTSEFGFKAIFKVKKKNLAGCDTSSGFDFPVNYSQTISLGELQTGRYTVEYNNNLKKVFSVEATADQTIDNSMYAPVSSAFIPELIYSNQNANVILTGIYQTNCLQLKDGDIEIKRSGNVFIVLPKVNFEINRTCRRGEFPLQAIVDLGPVTEPGHYLIHIRSQSGLAVNKVFHVKERSLDPSRHRK